MDILNGFLSHYQRLFANQKQQEQLILESIKEVTNLVLTNKEFRLKDGVLFIKTKPKYKIEIILNKNKLINLLVEKNLKVLEVR